jgi:hypothetical protein
MDAKGDPSYNRRPKCGHPCCSRCSGEEDDDPDHGAADAESGSDLEEWVSAALKTAAESRGQTAEEDHEQQAQMKPQED